MDDPRRIVSIENKPYGGEKEAIFQLNYTEFLHIIAWPERWQIYVMDRVTGAYRGTGGENPDAGTEKNYAEAYERAKSWIPNLDDFKFKPFGMIPSSEVNKSVTYYDDPDTKMRVRIDAGPNGWKIIFADQSTEYKNESVGTEANFREAYNRLIEIFPKAYEITGVGFERADVRYF